VKIYHSHLRVKSFLCVLKIGSILTPKDLESIIILYFTILFFAFYSIHVRSLSHYIYAKFKYYNFFIWLKILKLLERITKNFRVDPKDPYVFLDRDKRYVFLFMD